MEKTNFEAIALRIEISSRGGGIEIDLSTLGFEGKMTAYQNYLGGGMLGRVGSDCNIHDWRNDCKLIEISEELKKYYHDISNPDTEFERQTYEQNQNLPISAY